MKRTLLLVWALFSVSAFGQVAYQLAPVAVQQFVDGTGKPYAGGFLYTCTAGSTCPGNPLASYKDNAGTANANPIQLDANGRAVIYLGQSSYKFVLQNSSGVQQWAQDNVSNFTQAIYSTAGVWTATQTFNNPIVLTGGSSDATGSAGMLYYRTDLNRHRFFDTAWHSTVGADTSDTLTNKTLGSPSIAEGSCPSGSSGNDLLCGDSTDHLLHYNPNNAGLQQIPLVSMVTSVYTNATTAFSTVSFSPALPTIAANRTYSVRCEIIFQGSAGTAGPKFQVTGPAAATSVRLSVDGATASAGYAAAVASGFSNGNAALGTITSTGSDLIAHVIIGIMNGANSGAIALQAAANGAGTLTIQPDSFCVIQ